MYKLRDAGDLEGARQQMRDVLAVDPVPHHRWIAEGQLAQLDNWKPSKGKATAKRAAGKTEPKSAPPRKASPKKTARKKPPPKKRTR
jgi:hypothetical protein